MKRVIVAISSILIVIVAANLHSSRAQDAIQASASEPAADGSAPPTQNWAGGNPLKIALLKWFPAYHSTSFKVGKSPIGLAFDGENIWVSNQYGQSLTKLRANDGENLGTFTVGSGPTGVAFDGANIWTANSFDGTVTKLRASDGKNLGTFSVGQAPLYVAFDGQDIWVTNSGGASITKLRASDGTVLGTFADPGGYPCGIIFDGTYIWVANSNSNLQGTVTRFRLDGKPAGTFNVGGVPLYLAFDSANIWVGNTGGGRVTKMRASDGQILGTFNTGCCPKGIAFVNVWIVGSPYVVVLRASDGKLVCTTNDVQGGGAGIAFDGSNMWEAAYSVNHVSKW
jgi:outer membrane protein assembly factor BamB